MTGREVAMSLAMSLVAIASFSLTTIWLSDGNIRIGAATPTEECSK